MWLGHRGRVVGVKVGDTDTKVLRSEWGDTGVDGPDDRIQRHTKESGIRVVTYRNR